MQVDFAIECLNNGEPTGYLQEVASVFLVHEDGTTSDTFYRAEDLVDYLLKDSKVVVMAKEVVGPPRTDLFARFLCGAPNVPKA